MTEKEWTEFVNKYSAITPEEEVKEATVTSLILGLLTILLIDIYQPLASFDNSIIHKLSEAVNKNRTRIVKILIKE